MKAIAKVNGVILILALISLVACSHQQVIQESPYPFEEGIATMAKRLGDQLDRATIGNRLNRALGDALNKVKGPATGVTPKKITIDPFIDLHSGYPLKANPAIMKVISEELKGRYQVTGQMEPEILEASQYILTGYVTYRKGPKSGEWHDISATVLDKASGEILASTTVFIQKIDSTPMALYMDSPLFLKGRNYSEQVTVVRKVPGTSISQRFLNRLSSKALQVRGDLFYEKKEYKKSLEVYDELAKRQSEPDLEVLNGQFTNLIKQERMEQAERVYGKLLRVSLAESDSIFNKIFFGPKSVVPLESNMALYQIYMRQIAQYVASEESSCLQIVGHCSRSGSEAYNDKLSLQRAEWVHNQMASLAPVIRGRSQIVGRGFRNNLVGSGKDDITDAVDRRVEFRFIPCGSAPELIPEREEEDDPEVVVTQSKTDAKALSVEDIEFYLKEKVSNKIVASRIAERGVSFELDDQTRKRLKKCGANSTVFQAIHKVNAAK